MNAIHPARALHTFAHQHWLALALSAVLSFAAVWAFESAIPSPFADTQGADWSIKLLIYGSAPVALAWLAAAFACAHWIGKEWPLLSRRTMIVIGIVLGTLLLAWQMMLWLGVSYLPSWS